MLLNPNDADVLTNLGHVAREEGRDTLAVDYYQRAMKLDSTHAQAALALRNLIEQEQLTIRKPAEYWVLTPDERDYLIQIIYNNDEAITVFNEMSVKVKSLRKLHEPVYMLDIIQARQDIAAILEKTYQHMLKIYNNLNTMSVPPRLATLHYEFALSNYDRMVMLEWAFRAYPPRVSSSERKALNEEYKALHKNFKAGQLRLGRKLVALDGKASTEAVDTILEEAEDGIHNSVAADLPVLDVEETKEPVASAPGKPATASAAPTAAKVPTLPKKPEMPKTIISQTAK